MKEEILSEIYRIQEIMGHKKIINEFKIPSSTFAKSLVSGVDNEIANAVKSQLGDYATTAGKNVDEVYDDLIGELKLATDDAAVDTILRRYIPSAADETAAIAKIFDNLLSLNPTKFTEFALEANLGKKGITSIENALKADIDLELAQKYLDRLKGRVDELMNSEDDTLKLMGSNMKKSDLYQNMEKKVENLKKAESQTQLQTKLKLPETEAEWYEYYARRAKDEGKKIVDEGDFMEKLSQVKTIIGDSTSDMSKLIENLINRSKDKLTLAKFFENTFKSQGYLSKMYEVAERGILKITGSAKKLFSKMNWKVWLGILVTGMLLGYITFDQLADAKQRFIEAGSEYTETYDILVRRLGGQFTDLPKEVKVFIGSEFTKEQAIKNNTNQYITGIKYTPSSETETGTLEVKMNDNTIIKYETKDGSTFDKIVTPPPPPPITQTITSGQYSDDVNSFVSWYKNRGAEYATVDLSNAGKDARGYYTKPEGTKRFEFVDGTTGFIKK